MRIRAAACVAILGLLALAGCQTLTPTALTLSTSTTQASFGTPLTLSVNVAQYPSGGGVPTGTVAFFDGSTNLGGGLVSNGTASLIVSTLSVGTHQLAASFGGTNGWGSSTSNIVTVVVSGTRYQLSLGDSLAAGTGASAGHGYVDDIAAHESARLPGLVLHNIACGGATAASMINGPGCSYPQGTQLSAAAAFLTSHPGQVAYITIDIGANDVTGCVSSSGLDQTCAAQRVPVVQSNLSTILGALHTAAPSVPVFAMTYYDPFLAYWVMGNQTAATQSEAGVVTLNNALTSTYQAAGGHVVPVDVAFDTSNFAMTGTYQGSTVPQNVANICNWTLMCSQFGNIHANTTGHQVIADTFTPVIDAVVPAG